MKTTVELPDELLLEVQRVAREEGTSMKSLLEEGLRVVLERHRTASGFRLRDGSVAGNGLQPAFRDASWDEIRAAAYGDRL
jgi:metal-responsive CopG/Arc/MetJ family transcriptional regulator